MGSENTTNEYQKKTKISMKIIQHNLNYMITSDTCFFSSNLLHHSIYQSHQIYQIYHQIYWRKTLISYSILPYQVTDTKCSRLLEVPPAKEEARLVQRERFSKSGCLTPTSQTTSTLDVNCLYMGEKEPLFSQETAYKYFPWFLSQKMKTHYT